MLVWRTVEPVFETVQSKFGPVQIVRGNSSQGQDDNRKWQLHGHHDEEHLVVPPIPRKVQRNHGVGDSASLYLESKSLQYVYQGSQPGQLAVSINEIQIAYVEQESETSECLETRDRYGTDELLTAEVEPPMGTDP